MTQEDKNILLKDLCARLPYGVKVNATTPKGEKTGTIVTTTTKFIHLHQDSKIFGEFYVDDNDECFWLDFGLFKPYLRPMSSMTEKEFEQLKQYSGLEYNQLDLAEFPNNHKCLDFYLSEVPSYAVTLVFDWLNAHHFDYCLLIERGLALEAPEGMYKAK